MNENKQLNKEKGSASLFDQLRKKQPKPEHDKSGFDLPSLDLGDLFTTEDDQTTEEETIAKTVPSPAPSESDAISSDMPPEARRALVSLLRQGVILSSQKAKLFEALCRYQTAVRRHLAEVYLKLVLDEKTGVAFVAGMQKEEEMELDNFADNEIVSLLSRRTLSLYDTLLLLVLRKHYQDRETSGEQLIVIDRERVESHLTPFLPLTNSTKSDRRKLGPALERMVKKKILRKIRGSKDRYEITPVIRYVVSAEFLENMLNEYLRIASENDIDMTAGISSTEAQMKGDDND